MVAQWNMIQVLNQSYSQKNMNLSIITTILISSFVTVLSGVITNLIYDVLKRKGYLPDQLNNKSIIILVACIITLTAMYFLSTPQFIDKANPEYLQQIIRDIDSSQSEEERNRISPYSVLPDSQSGISGIHGPTGVNIPPNCYGLAWNVIINDKSYNDSVVVISQPTNLDILDNPVYKGYYITVCHKGNVFLSPEAIGMIQAAIMDKAYPLGNNRRWTWFVLN